MIYTHKDFISIFRFLYKNYGLSGDQSDVLMHINDSDDIPEYMKDDLIRKTLENDFSIINFHDLEEYFYALDTQDF